MFEILDTWFASQEWPAKLRTPFSSHRERLFFLEFQPALDGKDLTVYDIGASYGDVAVMLAKLSNVSTTYAFEPIPEVFQRLRERVNAFSNVICYNIALGAQNGPATFYQSKSSPSSSLLTMGMLHKSEFPKTAHIIERRVDVVRLDDWVQEHELLPPDFVKIDVQGFEDRVLAGGEKTIRQARCCVVETSLQHLYEGSPLFHEIYGRLHSWGFEFAGFSGGIKSRAGRLLYGDGLFIREQS